MSDYIPNTQGTVVLKGYEKMVRTYNIKNAITKLIVDELELMKDELRTVAKTVLAKAAPGTKRLLFRDDKGGGVEISKPDLAKLGNRPYFSQATQTAIAKKGGIEALGDAASAVDSTTQVTLTGTWAPWFLKQLQAFKDNGTITDDKANDGVKADLRSRLTEEGVAKLTELSGQDGEAAQLAQFLLDNCIKNFVVASKE